MSRLTKCDQCRLAKTPICYIRTSRKLCIPCWQAEKLTNQSLIRSLPKIEDREAPLGYNFVINDYFLNQEKGKRYADYAYASLSVCLS